MAQETEINAGGSSGYGGAGAEDKQAASAPNYDYDYVINLWASPRSLSTSLMYSFAQRADTEVVDEPLYAHFLHKTGAPRPYRDLVLASMENDGAKVCVEVVYAPQRETRLRFVKHMAKHCMQDIAPLLLGRGRHVLLVRDPIHVISSFGEVATPTLDETGLPHLACIYSTLRSNRNTETSARHPAVIVVDSGTLQANPEGTLRALCQALAIPFDAHMLQWEAGPRPEDGVWAPWWYETVHKSRGFHAPRTSADTARSAPVQPFPMQHYALLEESRPFYTMLRRHALKPLRREQQTSSWVVDDAPVQLPVPANEQLLVWVGDGLEPRSSAKVHVLDSIVQGGDGVWEGLRVYDGRVFKLDQHLDRMMDSAKAMAFQNVPSRDEIVHALVSTLAANGMRDNVHVRLTLTRGLKVTSGMSPHFNRYGCTIIVLAEWKPPVYDNSNGIRLVTASTRRNSPQCVDSKIHHNNLINNILAKIEGNNAGADDAVMLDVDGFVSETNATNIFMVKNGVLLTPFADSCLPGITRATVLELAAAEGIRAEERRISLSQLHCADEVFTTGSMGELTPCVEIDSRPVGPSRCPILSSSGNSDSSNNSAAGPVTRQLQAAYARLTASEGWSLPPFPAASPAFQG